MFGIGTSEMILILIVGLLLFGKRLPEVGRSIGKSIVELKKGLREVESEVHEVDRLTDEAVRDAERRLTSAESSHGKPAPPGVSTPAHFHDDKHG